MEKEKMIELLKCKEKKCKHFIEKSCWTFCDAIFTSNRCFRLKNIKKKGNKYVK
jgi:hypothetical protein